VDLTPSFVTEKPWPGLIDRIFLGDVLIMPPRPSRSRVPRLLKPVDGTYKFRSGYAREADRDAQETTGRASRAQEGLLPLHPEFSARLAVFRRRDRIMKDVLRTPWTS